MTAHFKRGLGAAIILASTSQMALAEVTAQDVWSDWKAYITSAGYELGGTESTSGDTLTISDLSMSIDIPNNEGSVTFGMSSLVFAGKSDGTVEVTMPGSMPMQITGQEDGNEFDVAFNITQGGHSMTVSGDPSDLAYQYTASRVGLMLASLMIGGQPATSDMARASVTLTNVNSTSQVKTGDLRSYTQSMSVGSLNYDVEIKDPDTDGNGTFQGSIVDLSFKGQSAIPLNMDSGDIRAMLDAGFALDGSFIYGGGNSNLKVVGNGEDFSMKSSSQGGKLGLVMNGARIVYDFWQNGLAIDVATNMLPFPIVVEAAEIGFKIDMPVAQSDEEQDFAFLVRLQEFSMSDVIWGLFDPGAVLPRNPATVIVDLAGKGKILADILNPAMAATLSGPPGELNAVTIKQLLVSVAGSKLSGTGDFTFDNNDLASFDGFPAPTGEANLEMVGANGLMDNLIKMGLLADSDAAIPRMMMGMLTIPGDGEDTLISKIEFGEGGSISANGQRIK